MVQANLQRAHFAKAMSASGHRSTRSAIGRRHTSKVACAQPETSASRISRQRRPAIGGNGDGSKRFGCAMGTPTLTGGSTTTLSHRRVRAKPRLVMIDAIHMAKQRPSVVRPITKDFKLDRAAPMRRACGRRMHRLLRTEKFILRHQPILWSYTRKACQ